MNQNEFSKRLGGLSVPGADEAEDRAALAARSGVAARRRARQRPRALAGAVAAGLIAALMLTPAGGAVADQIKDLVAGDELDPQPALPGAEPRPMEGESPQPLEEPNYVADRQDPPERVTECRRVLGEGKNGPNRVRLGTCQVIVARAEGNLEPGWYSNAELGEALERAGVAP